MKLSRRWLGGLIAASLLIGGAVAAQDAPTSLLFRRLHRDVIVNADIWSAQPEILSAGYGFDNIIGVDGGEAEVRAAGGAWNSVECSSGADPARSVLTSSAPADGLTNLFDQPTSYSDGLPVVFSMPVLPSTVNHTDFLVTLNTGATVVPDSASIYPNWELNERHVVVLFGQFGNRSISGEAGAEYVVRVDVVADATPLTLVSPSGLVTAVGLFKESTLSPYESGPYLVGAKLNRISAEGEGGVQFLNANMPNDGITLYGAEAQYRLRLFTSGSFSPDGVRGLRPNAYEDHFRIQATRASGRPLMIEEVGLNYTVRGGTIRVIGLADLGRGLAFTFSGHPVIAYDDCYEEDHDNYIDIILAGDEEAMRSITAVEVPAAGDYLPFYNPGGPGNNPTPGVRYTAPGPADLEPVIIALDDPMTVSYGN